MKKIMAILTSLLLLLTALPLGSLAESADDARAHIESVLNLANNAEQAWTYSAQADAWTLSVVSAVAYPELPDQQGVSVCVPGAYVTGIDTDKDGSADVTAADAQGAVKGALVIDHNAQVVSTNGQTYTASTAPLLMTTGAAGYGSQNNSAAFTNYAKEGYIAISCGNRGKQDTATDADGSTYYTGDAPSCLVDQKAAARFVKYNILLGNLPGCADYLVVTGGSGGGAHAAMFAATSNNPDFYDYQIEAGAVGVYRNADGSYDTTVTIDGQAVALSDGAWGCVAYSAITSLYEADAAQAFEYYMDTTYEFNTPFQAQLAEYLSEAYMNYINAQNLTVDEAKVGFDLNSDGDTVDTIALTIEYDAAAHPETNGYYGTYLELYRAEFRENLQWYLDNLDYAEGWTWFDADGNALSDEAVAAMTGADKAEAFIEGRYAKGSTGGMGMMGMGGMPGNLPDGELPDGMDAPGGKPGDLPDGELPDGMGGPGSLPGDDVESMFGEGIRDGGPMMGSTASAGGGKDSANYATFDEMAADYASDVAEIYAGDEYGKNIVALYNPLNYIGAEGTDDPAWTRVVMGAVEGDISMMTSLNLEIAWLNADVDTVIEWQWDGGHVPSEVLGNSLALYVDAMYGKHVSGVETTKPAASVQTTNGTATAATGADLSAWVDAADVDFTLADILAYRNSGASKAVPGFDVIDHGQENYVFGNESEDARHWNVFLNNIFQNEAYAEALRPLFNAGAQTSAEAATAVEEQVTLAELPAGDAVMPGEDQNASQAMPAGDMSAMMGGTPPEMPEGGMPGMGENMGTSPEIPEGGMGENMGASPEMPEGGMPGGMGGEMGNPPAKPDGEMSGAAPGGMMPGGMQGAPTEYAAVHTVTEDAAFTGGLESTGKDENLIHVTSGTATVTDAVINRESADSTGGDTSSFYGVGAAVLTTGGTVIVENSTITTDAAGGAGVFAYGDGVAYVSDTTITTAQNTAGGIHVAGGGTLYARNLTVTTEGESAAAIRSDRGSGLMVVDGGTYTSHGEGSPAVYVTADISIHNADLNATGSEALCMEGLNTVRLFDCDLSGAMKDLSQNDNTWTVIVYQSMSGDSEIGKGHFEMSGGTLESANGGLFYTTNTESEFVLSNVAITASEGSEYFLRVTGNANQRGWGSTGKNGANCTFTGLNQLMQGDVQWDSISTLDMYVAQGSRLIGAVINDESCAGAGGNGYCNLYIDADSSWVVTGDSVLTSLQCAGSIADANGNTVTIRSADGTVLAEGTSEFTITVAAYADTCDLSSAGAVSAWESHAVDF